MTPDETTVLDPRPIRETEVADLERRFPGVRVWFGFHTREWWGLVPGAARLIEAPNPDRLRQLVAAAFGGQP